MAGIPTVHPRSAAARYAAAVLLVFVAMVLRLALDKLVGEDWQPYATVYAAVAITVWWVGLGPAIVAIVLGLVTSLWGIVPPRDSLAIRGAADVVDILIYLFVVVTIVVLTRSMQMARAALAKSNERLEAAVRERTAKLQDNLTDLEHMSYAMAHDLQGPLRAMRSYAELARIACADGDLQKAAGFCQRVNRSTERMQSLIRDSLIYNRIIREQLPIEPVDLSTLVPGIVESYPDLEMHKNEIQIDRELPWVLGNVAALTQCFSNLLGNAIKFVREGVEPEVVVAAEHRGDKVRVWVQDNGIGIRKEDQGRIFGMFERLGARHEGNGVGLAIVQTAMRRIGGGSGVESEPGHGSRFWIELPEAKGSGLA